MKHKSEHDHVTDTTHGTDAHTLNAAVPLYK